MDSFHVLVRHAIRSAWGNPEKRTRLTRVAVSDFAVWSCGDSANRLCELLTGDEMKTVLLNGEDASNDSLMRDAYKKMRSSPGRLVARVQLRHRVAGHAFVWVSEEAVIPHTLEGYVYQTNVGISTQEFDLVEWISDSKSEESLFFPAYIAQLQATFGKVVPGGVEPGERPAVYAREFFTQSKIMPEEKKQQMTSKARDLDYDKVVVMWKAVDDTQALGRFGEIIR